MGKIRCGEAVSVLCAALQDKNRGIREAAAWALGKIGCVEAIPALLAALEDENTRVYLRAITALHEFGPNQAVAILIQRPGDWAASISQSSVDMPSHLRLFADSLDRLADLCENLQT